MKRLCILIHLLLLSALCFAQQNAGIMVIGRIPDATDSNLYQMQVGAFKLSQNASSAFEKLKAASLNPSYEEYKDLTRVLIRGVKAKDVPSYIERIRRAGFSEVFIKIGTPGAAATQSSSAGKQSSAGQKPSTGKQSSAGQKPSTGKQPPAADSWEDSYISESHPEKPHNNGTEDAFPEPGLWKLTGRDPAGGEWKADIVIKNVRNNNFDGYFDWHTGYDFDYYGREYFNGQFDMVTSKITFQGTRLENSQDLVLGKYEAYVSTNKDELYNGRWEEPDEIPLSYWKATKDK